MHWHFVEEIPDTHIWQLLEVLLKVGKVEMTVFIQVAWWDDSDQHYFSITVPSQSHMRCDWLMDWLTPQTGQHADVSSIEQRQCIMIDVQVRKMRDEVIPHQETHQNPVVYDPL